MEDSLLSQNRESPQEFAKRLRLPFTDFFLLSRALTHRSYLNEHFDALEDNERLEFLGDAVLDFIVAAWLYNRYPEMAEGDLTRLRSALVYTEQLAEFARAINLGNVIRLGRGESNGRGNDRTALLCDTFEAVVGALYLDAGLHAVEIFIFPLLEQTADDILLNNKYEDPKSLLQEWAQSQGYPSPQYQTKDVTGPEHLREFAVEVLINGDVLGFGSGHSKQMATKAAAQDALQKFGVNVK